MIHQTDHHVVVGGARKVFTTYDEGESAGQARARGKDKLHNSELLSGTDFEYEFGFTTETPGVQEERHPILVRE